MTHVLLAGATGAVGTPLVPLLLAAGHRVTALSRSADRAAALRARGVKAVAADVLDRDGVLAAVTAAAPEVVMHQLTDLGSSDFAANTRMRVVGSRNLVDAANAAGVRRVIAQSIAWVYAAGTAPAREDEPLDTDTGTDQSRSRTVAGVVALESAVAEIAEAVILRYGTFYGPGTWYAPGAAMADAAAAGRLVADETVTSFVHVEDAAMAAVAALDWPGGVVNVCDDEPAAAREWLPAFCRAVGAPGPPVGSGRALWARGADNGLARSRGWGPTRPSWRTGFAELRCSSIDGVVADPTRESPGACVPGAEGAILPGISQAPGPRGRDASGK